MNKKYKIYLQQSWMGDTLFACNVVKNLEDIGYDIILYHRWPFMTSLIELFGIKQNINPDIINLDEYETILYNGRIDVFDNPLLDYAKVFNIKGASLEQASKFYPLHEAFNQKYEITPLSKPYITFDLDWQGRTSLNIDYILSELSKEFQDRIDIYPIGGDRFNNDPNPLMNSAVLLVNSRFHLGMIGGTTNLATFMNTKCIGDCSYLYNFYSTRGEEHGYMFKDSLTPEKFLNIYYCLPHHWADKKHIIANPNISNDDFINLVKFNLNEAINNN
jgi:hypothetical protein